MKITTDKSHKSFTPKKIVTIQDIKMFFIKLAVIGSLAGCILTMSGCSSLGMDYSGRTTEGAMEAYYDGTLHEFDERDMDFFNVPVYDDLFTQLSPKTELLSLFNDFYIQDLSNLPISCPNIISLHINFCPNITDWSFLDNMDNLQSLWIVSPTYGITQELINKLDARGIKHNLTQEMVDNCTKLDEIADSLFTEDMDDNAKMRAIANYVTSHMSYDRDRSKVEDYNYNPIHYALQGTGVCVNYSALTQALCQRANLEGYVMNNDDHVWNLIKLDGKYYYFDITNMMQLPLVSDLLLKINTGFYYKQDPYNTGFSAMTNLNKIETPEQLSSLIKEAQDEKTFIEKYGSNLYVDLTVLVGVLISVGVIVKVRQHFK